MKQELSKGLVAIPEPTLNALKNLLLSAEGIINISPIVNDLAISENCKDMLAINIALVMKGIKPDIGKFRFKKEGNLLITWELTHFSLINGVVTVRVSARKYDSGTKTFTDYDIFPKENNIDYSEWAEASSNKKEIIDKFEA